MVENIVGEEENAFCQHSSKKVLESLIFTIVYEFLSNLKDYRFLSRMDNEFSLNKKDNNFYRSK